ncbi:MAG: translation initiation factor IF-6 [Thermoplasmata archaeon HGW-Thermoplasmata-2]|nr:MAG: translation initiation factor IF-6 [Thermoplasmata archaeon HGW-Thermoplasmata-2]
MKIARMDVLGNPFLGVFCRVNDSYALVPPGLPKDDMAQIAATLGVEVTPMTIGCGTILGSLIAMNNKGALVVDYAGSEEIAIIKKALRGMNVATLGDRNNAAGNNVLVNDRCAVVSPEMSAEWAKTISDALGVEVVKMSIAGCATVGSAAVATSKGCLCHPRTTDEEMAALKQALGVEALNGTINHGGSMIGAGIMANGKGAIAGSLTTGIELARIEEALGFLE